MRMTSLVKLLMVLAGQDQSRFELIYPVEVKGKKAEQEKQLDSIPEEEAEPEEQQEPQAPEHRHELAGELSFIWNGHEYNQQNTLKTLKALCTEFGISRFGSKHEILRRLSRTVPSRPRDITSLAQLRRSIRNML